jgi:pimeloyl-ACP methyl ester carboxylesterase
MSVSYFTNSKGIKLAFVHSQSSEQGVKMPVLVFLGGFKSDMGGTKALFLEERCRNLRQEYLRFDYSGHGQSEGEFVNGTIGSWLNDAREIISSVIQASEVIVVGSSMGGWLGLRLLIDSPEGDFRIKGMIGVAAAPDFTKDVMADLTAEQHLMLADEGYVKQPSDYDEPYIFTRRLFDDGEVQSLLSPAQPYKTQAMITLLQGRKDDLVHWTKAQRIAQAFDGPQTKVIFVDDGDHSLSQPDNLALLDEQISQMIKGV